MNDQEKKDAKEILRIEKLKAEEAQSLAREQARAKAYQDREKDIEKAQAIKDAQRAESRSREEAQEQAREKARKDAYLSREKKMAEEHEIRKSKNKD
jgi:hypothetical protein